MWTVNKSRSALGLLSASVFALILFTSALVSAQTCPFDNGGATLENDGLVLTRYALGLRGATMVANTSFAAVDAPTIESNIACPSCGLRVTDDKDALNNPVFTVADATIISRKLAGFTGTALTNGIASLGTGTRNTPAAVQSFLIAGCGATGGTVTSVTAGNGLLGGTFATSGTIAADTAYLQRRVSNACGTGSYITAIAADGTPTCGTPPASGGSGTVTSIALGDGLTNNVALPLTSGGNISTTGTVLLTDSYRLPQSCTSGQVPQRGPFNHWNCVDLPVVGTVFTQGGNAFGVPGVIGTTDGQNMKIVSAGKDFRATIAGKQHGLRITQGTGPGFTADITPNVINGHETNSLTISPTVGVTIAGGGSSGQPNTASGGFATVSGGNYNTAAYYSSVGGGEFNRATGDNSAIGGGLNNISSDYAATVGGGINNSAGGLYSTISGGNGNTVTGLNSTISGGFQSVAGGSYSTVSGGYGNRTAGNYSSALGGTVSYALGNYSVVTGGQNNTASGFHSIVAGGDSNQATANWSTTLGGLENVASGLYSIAAGQKAKATAIGSFVWADTRPGEYFGGIQSETQTAINSFNLRASGGINFNLGTTKPVGGTAIGMRYYAGTSQDIANEEQGYLNFSATGLSAKSLFAATSIRANGSLAANQGLMVSGFFGTTQCFIVAGGFCLGQSGSWTSISDRAQKKQFAKVDVTNVLQRVLSLPVQYWSYLEDAADSRYIGPMAQDFKRLFQVGDGDKTISPTNASGVALAAIQGLNQKLTEQIKQKDSEIAKLRAKADSVEREMLAIKRKLGM
jgi:hypothetical protein